MVNFHSTNPLSSSPPMSNRKLSDSSNYKKKKRNTIAVSMGRFGLKRLQRQVTMREAVILSDDVSNCSAKSGKTNSVIVRDQS